MILLAASLIFLFISAIAQPVLAASPGTYATDTEKTEFVVGLTLSGGGAAGLAHIGVLKVFEEVGMPVDVIAGTSMGAIVGALYAIGYDQQQIEQIARATDWRQLLVERIHRIHLPMEEKMLDGRFILTFQVKGRNIQFPTGLVSGNHTFNFLAQLTWNYHNTEDFRTLPRPFLCIATDLETGEQVVLDRGFLPDAIRASMSIPSVFKPVRIDDKYLVDGGLVNNLPVQETFDLGADFVIAINSSSDLKPADELMSLPDIVNQTMAAVMRSSILNQKERADYYLQPNLRKYTTLSFSDVDEIIQAGEDAAREHIDEIRALADSLNHLRGSDDKPEVSKYMSTSYLNIRKVRFEGLETVPEDHIRSKLQIADNSVIHESTLNQGLLRLYGMHRFNKITYRLHLEDDEVDLTIYFEEQTTNYIQAGVHHNSTTGPSLLFNTTFRDMFFPASTARLNIRAGYEAMAEVQYFNYIGIEPRLSFYGAGGFREREIDVFEGGRRQSNLRTDILYGEGLIGPLYASIFRAGVGYHFEYFNLTESYGELVVPINWNSLHVLAGELEFDNLNRSHMPTNGHHFEIRTDFSPKFLPNEVTFGRVYAKWNANYPATNRLTILQQTRAGHIFGGNPPLHYRFYAGGHQQFWGYRKDALAGNNLLTLRLAAQYQFYRNFYVTPGVNIGDIYDQLDLSVFDRYPLWGWATILGWNTLLGPLELVLMGSNDNPVLYEFRVGLNF